MKTKRKLGIHGKALIGILLFTLCMNVLMCLSGSVIFDKVVQKLYNERGYVVAHIILKQLDHDKIAEYTQTWEEDEYYRKMVEYLEYIQEFSNAAYIYIGVPYEDKTIKYVYDSGSHIGFEDPIAAPFDELWTAYTEGVRPTSYLVRHSKYGYLTSSCLPVKDSKGNVVALLFVDTNMKEIQTTLFIFIRNMVIIALLLLSVFCLLNWRYVSRNLIDPIVTIRDNINKFAETAVFDDTSIMQIRTNDEMEDLAKSISKMEAEIVDYIKSIQIITAEKERISAELNVATKIQADMLPSIFPPFPNRKEFDIYATMTPAKEVGGDFYDFFLIDDNHLALVMADVAGKGVPAALFMVNAKTLIKNRALMDNQYSPAQILTDVNNQICATNDTGLFVTVWLAIIDLTTGKGLASNAGHEHPAIKRKDGYYEFDVYKHSPAVAAMDGIRFREHEFELHPGDVFFVYTDGVTEATNAEDELYGSDRLLKALNSDKDANAMQLLQNVKTDINEFVKESPQFDDITMLCFRYFGLK